MYWTLIAVITLHGGGTVEKPLQNLGTPTFCETIRQDPAVLPSFQTKPIEGEKSRVYECREAK